MPLAKFNCESNLKTAEVMGDSIVTDTKQETETFRSFTSSLYHLVIIFKMKEKQR